MKLTLFNPAKSLQAAHRAQSLRRESMEGFKREFRTLLGHIEAASSESEEHLKNLVADFLKNSWYKSEHYINTRERQDLVIHNGKNAQESVGVILEVKKPGNRAEMISAEKPNAKALHELLRYYLSERADQENRELRRLIVTNIESWFIFDAADFERQVYGNKKLLKNYSDWKEGRIGAPTTDWFYKEIAAPFFDRELPELNATHFKLSDFAPYVLPQAGQANDDPADDDKLLDFYKILSPEHLLKKPFANDSNALNKSFYEELLYIIGLEEVKDGGKKLIKRAEKRRHDGSLLENTLSEIEISGSWRDVSDLDQFGETPEEQRFSIALELCITWLNRILFLKLLEGQLKRWTGSPGILNAQRVKDYDELNELFFHVLAVPENQRRASVQEKFGNIPYLNSSLFEQSELERRSLRISALKDRLEMPLYAQSVLKDATGKRQEGKRFTLLYLFDFLDAYDFSSDARARIQEDNKDIINASVLGLIFEKINGYRDGSFFTPGFITMYMCRESIRQAVLQKFNEKYGWDCQNLETELYNRLDRVDTGEANALINSLRICDPAVGSGHFLVSALNELIAVKSELGILCDPQGKKLRELRAVVGNDELLLTQRDTDQAIEYKPGNSESQRIQESLFHEKQNLIENCLFGVDINPKSVMICRLRLWVELLKHAYFTEESKYKHLETLPNIDINIKTGNSLISRFALDEDLSDVFRKQKFSRKDYLLAVESYKRAQSKDGKEELRRFIDKIKDEFRQTVFNRNPFVKKMSETRGKIALLDNVDLFGEKKLSDKDAGQQRRKLQAELSDLEEQLQAYKSGPLYRNAFEWRFEFPEVLDEAGNFAGFDVVVGNPPYIRQEELGAQKTHFQQQFQTFSGTADLYVYFVERGMQILRPQGLFSYILPNKWMRAGYGDKLRQYVKQFRIRSIADFGDLPVFEEATTYPCVFELQRTAPSDQFQAVNIQTLSYENGLPEYIQQQAFSVNLAGLQDSGWTLTNQAVQALLEKLRAAGKPLGEYVNGKIYYGIKTGLNEAFVIDAATRARLIEEDPKSAEVIKPFLAGRDIKRYQTPVSDKYLIFTRRGIDIQQYPAILAYLSQFKERLMPKPKGHKGDWPGRKEGTYLWYEIQDAVDYWGEFEGEKVVYQEIMTFQSFSFDDQGFYANNKIFIIPNANKALLAILNSKIVWFYLNQTTSKLQGNALAMQSPYVLAIPIPPVPDHISNSLNSLATRILDLKKTDPQADTSDLEAEVDGLVYGLYGLGEEERGIVEGKS